MRNKSVRQIPAAAFIHALRYIPFPSFHCFFFFPTLLFVSFTSFDPRANYTRSTPERQANGLFFPSSCQLVFKRQNGNLAAGKRLFVQ